MPAAPAFSQTVSGEAEVRIALNQWMKDFNDWPSEKVCDIFAPTLARRRRRLSRARLRDASAMCCGPCSPDPEYFPDLRARDQGSPRRRRHGRGAAGVDADLEEKSSGETKVTEEQGLDIFGRSSDGRWQIIRFMSFER